MGLDLALIIPDSHIPYHDEKAYRLMIKVAKFYRKQLKEIVSLGDYGDFYSVMFHAKHPKIDQMLQTEVESINAHLDELDELFPRAKKVFIEGNHEYRLERYICDKAPSLFGITDIKLLLKLNQRKNWKFVPYGPNQQHKILNSKLMAKHEPPPGQIFSAAKEAGCSIVFGHVHRRIEGFHVNLQGVQRGAYCPGWLGDKRYKDVFGYVKNHHQWQLGFDLVFVDQNTKRYYRQGIHILDNYTCSVNGKLFKL